MPKVSIIIPTYKRAHYLKKILDNIHKQTFTDFEIIVVDDGTPGDENEQICSKYPNVIYKKIPNSGGPMIPRNTGFKIAKGEYIALVDDDDLWIEEKLERQVKILDNEKDYGLVHGYCKVINEHDKLYSNIIGYVDNDRKHGYVFDDMIGNFTLMTPTVFFRKQLLDLTGGFNESMKAAGEDTEFFCRLAFFTKFYYINEPLAFYRVHSNNVPKSHIGYAYLPIELYKVIKKLKKERLLNKKRFITIRKRLLIKQIECINDKKTAMTAIINCWKMNPLYWITPKNIYILLKKYYITLKKERKSLKK